MSTETPCPLPGNEPQRVKAVHAYEILDTPPEPEFDALTRLAAHAFAVPIAVVAMMDSDRLWFKSRLGLDIPQLDRKIAFCAYAIMRPDEPLVVPDLAQDARFADNPLVAQPPHLRFYAGAPIVDTAGNALGTIAVIDARPRSLRQEQREALTDLATLAITVLDSRRRAIDLRRLALTDHLTGIANRAQFDLTIDAELAAARRSGLPLSLIALDVDDFKNVNDTHGHLAGDEVLREVASRLASLTRRGDTLARLGGDEYAVLMRDADSDAAAVLARRVVESVQLPIRLANGEPVQVGLSVGTATCRDGASSPDTLRALADRAMYASKGRQISGDATLPPAAQGSD